MFDRQPSVCVCVCLSVCLSVSSFFSQPHSKGNMAAELAGARDSCLRGSFSWNSPHSRSHRLISRDAALETSDN